MLEKIQQSWPVILACMTALNLLLSAMSAAIEKVLAVKPSDAGQKADSLIKKALSVLQTVIDWLAPRTSQAPKE
jgi:hypothetical protein